MPEDQRIGDPDYDDERQYGDEEHDLSPEDKIRQIMQQIEELVQDQQAKWCDPDFPADNTSLYIDPLAADLPKYAIGNVEWKRPEEIYTGEDGPMMMKDGYAPGDVKQG